MLVRTDGGGGTHDYVQWLTDQKLQHSVGFTLTEDHVANIATIPKISCTQAYDADGKTRDGAWVVDAIGALDLASWPKGMRVLIRSERPHPDAQLRFTDLDINRLTAFATNTLGGRHADLELWHRRRARWPGPDPQRKRYRPAEPTADRVFAEPNLQSPSSSWPPN